MTVQLAIPVDREPVESIRNILLEQIGNDTFKLPLLPPIATQVLTLTSDPKADAAKLSSLIQQDQSLAGHILRLVNSPAFMTRSPIVSLQQGIAWLGIQAVADLALTISIQSGVFRVKEYETQIQGLWRHALASALFGKEIARRRRQNVENAFLCGLLHTIGKPIILHEVLAIQRDKKMSLAWEALQLLMTDYHITVGQKVAENWHLPEQVKVAITYYRDYANHQEDSLMKGAMITCLADQFATDLLDSNSGDQESLTEHPVIQDLNLYPEDMDALFAQGEPILKTVDSMAV